MYETKTSKGTQIKVSHQNESLWHALCRSCLFAGYLQRSVEK